MELGLFGINGQQNNPCTWTYLEVFEGDGTDGPSVGKWCNDVAPPPIVSNGNSLTLHLLLHRNLNGYFVASYSVLNTGTLDKNI